MEDGPPESKRMRLDAGPWANGVQQHQPPVLPPPLQQQHHSQTYSRPQYYAPPRHPEERPHHEPEGAHRPPPAGPPPPYPRYGGRDPMEKIDGSNEPPPPMHQGRPRSTGNIADNFVKPKNPDERRRQTLAYDHPSTQQSPSQPPYQAGPVYSAPPPHAYPERQFEPSTPSGGYSRDQVYNDFAYSSAGGNQKKKAPRTSQACDACRAAKARCNDPKPCSACVDKGIECIFQPPLPKQGDKVQNDILAQLSTALRVIDGVAQAQLNAAQAQLKAEQDRQHLLRALHIAVPGLAEAEKLLDLQSKQEGLKDDRYEPEPETPSVQIISTTEVTPYPDPDLDQAETIDDEDDLDNGAPVLPSELAIPIGHTTGAARLLQWKAIDAIVGERVRMDKYNCDPNRRENKRGLLRLYGRGEGSDKVPGETKDQQANDTQFDDSSSETASPAATPGASDNLWGQLGVMSPAVSVSMVHRGGDEHRNGTENEAVLDVERETISRLVASYRKHINNMHPILFPPQIDFHINNFLKSSSDWNPNQRQPPAGFVGVPTRKPDGSAKRKWSPGPGGESFDVPALQYLNSGRVQRSIGSAIVLLILALGKICEHRTKIPDVVSDFDRASTDSPGVQNEHPSPSYSVPNPSQQSPNLSSPRDSSGRSRLFQRQPNIQTPSRNIDVIPGLAYFASATDILGNQAGGNTLQHVQANLLAGLYQGQLGRVFESHSYICHAARALQVILIPKLERFGRCISEPHTEKTQPRDNQLLFMFWICLQLESDIIAELNVPQSHILGLESSVPWPNFNLAVEKHDMTWREMHSYLGQLWLRKRLNEIHKFQYAPGKEENYDLMVLNKKTKEAFWEIEEMQAQINGFMSMIGDLKWKESDDYATDILGARLRAKYFGAHVILYRPFLRMVLDNRFADSKHHIPPEEISPIIMDYAHKGVKALISSTSAFYGLSEGRLIVTNVFGTAHAQWGNVLALQAAYQNPQLRPFIDGEELRYLTGKTRDFLANVAQPSSSLKVDQIILEHAAFQTGMSPRDGYSSFSSAGAASDTATPRFKPSPAQ